MKNPYDVLGVSRGASAEDIKRAFRKLARERHPDADPNNPWAEDDFKELNAAYDLLSDPDRRAAFDRGEIDADGNRRRPGGGFRSSGTTGGRGRNRNPFEDYFRQREKRQRSGIKVKGANVDYQLRIDFLEAVRGTIKQVGMTTGKRLKVTVPAGTRDGQVLRLKGQGMPGIGGADAGDALVEITVLAHDVFSREDDDVHVDLAVTLPEAVLGAKVEAPTVDGPVAITIPANSNTGTKLRLRGKGIAKNGGPKNSGGNERGDQYVTLKVVLPEEPDEDLAKFVRKWAAKNPYEARAKKATAD